MLGVPPPQRLEWAPSVVSTSCRAGARSARIIVRLPSSMPPHRGVRGVEAVIERFISVRHRRLSLASLTVPAGQRPRRVGRRQSGHTCPIFSTHILDKLVSTLSQKVYSYLPPSTCGLCSFWCCRVCALTMAVMSERSNTYPWSLSSRRSCIFRIRCCYTSPTPHVPPDPASRPCRCPRTVVRVLAGNGR